jgi:hypothetical protein
LLHLSKQPELKVDLEGLVDVQEHFAEGSVSKARASGVAVDASASSLVAFAKLDGGGSSEGAAVVLPDDLSDVKGEDKDAL